MRWSKEFGAKPERTLKDARGKGAEGENESPLLADSRRLGCYGSLVLFRALRPMQPDALVNDIQFDDAIFL